MGRPQRTRTTASGRFVLRIQPGLHAALRAAAQACGMSLNEYCGMKLAQPAEAASGLEGARAALERAAEVLGTDLAGLVAFGSWARGEATVTSDVDLLIVVDARRPVTRGLYRDWDREPVVWDDRPVEPHFVHLPANGEAGTIWAEAALDGIVLFERELIVSRTLAAVRRQIADGKLVRRVIHGQPYWADVA
jgi:predicted nucleotidyltransferase